MTIKVGSMQGRDSDISVDPGRRASKVTNLRHAYGFDDVSLAPGTEHGGAVRCGHLGRAGRSARSRIPVLASADGRGRRRPLRRVSLAGLGGVAVLNLEGVQARYDDPDVVLERIATAAATRSRRCSSDAYEPPIRDERLVASHQRAARGRLARGRLRDARLPPAMGPVLCRAWCGPVPGAVAGVVRRSTSRRATSRWSSSEFTQAHAHPGGGRQHHLLRGSRVPADGARVSPPSSWVSVPVLPARHGRCWASACRR